MINNNQDIKGNFFIFNIFFNSFLIMTNLQLVQTQVLKDVSAELLAHPHNMQIQINWNKNITSDSKLDVTVTPISEHCHQGVCIEDGINVSSGSVMFPKHATSIVNTTPECSIDPDCEYDIKVETQNRQEIKNFKFHVPDCSHLLNSVCSCRTPYLPEISISGKLLNNDNSINITWNLYKTENIIKLNVTKIQVITTIHNKTNPLLSWGGRLKLLGIYNFTINDNFSSISNDNKSYNGFQIHKIPPISSIGSHYLIIGWVVDNEGCIGIKRKFTLIVPNIKNELQIAPEFYTTHLITIFIPISILIIVIILTSNLIYKRFKKTQTDVTSNWRSIYRNVSSASGLHQISMEENLLYLDKDILDAQEKGKADIFEIPHNSIMISHEIGKGAFGRVFKATVQNLHRKPGVNIVAVKQLKKRPLSAEIEEFLSEIQMMKNVGRHENVVALLGCCTIKEPYMMVMEYVGHGDLLQYLRNIRKKHIVNTSKQNSSNNSKTESYESSHYTNNNPSIPIQGKYLELQLSSSTSDSINSGSNLRPSITETMYTILSGTKSASTFDTSDSLDCTLDSKELHNFAIQIARGMAHLEEKGITHRDLAARNVLIDEHKTLKISDFGLSRSGIYVKPKDKAKLLPLRWLSIEAIYDNLYSSKSDVWAFGIVLWEIGTLGGFPYPTLSNHELLKFLLSGKRLEKPEICTNFLYNLMLSCWNEDPDKRPTFFEILKSLQSQKQKIYVNFNDIGPDYVFPPIKEQIKLDNNNSKTSTPNLSKKKKEITEDIL